MTIVVRDERPEDHVAVAAVHRAAFENEAEGDLVAALRGEGGVISLVAVDATDAVVGHIAFSPATLPPRAPAARPHDCAEGSRPAFALAPLGVLPAHQRSGIGTVLTEEGLARCRAIGAGAVIVLGDPAYYPRFGFRPAETWGLRSRWDVPPGVLQAMELVAGSLEDRAGRVAYHPAFDLLD